MDIHLTNAQATAEERTAVDSELGASDAASPQAENNGHAAWSVTRVHIPRHRLLPVLHAIQARIGWISAGALNYAAQRLYIAPADVYGVASFYGMFALAPRAPIVAHVCDDIACLARGADKV